MNKEAEVNRVAATAVAAAIASATAEHIAKQSNPTMGAKAAARAAEVADAVAKGDSERASQAVIAAAKAVEEIIAFSVNRQSISSYKPIGEDSMTSLNDNTGERRPIGMSKKSRMCTLL